MKMFRNLIFVLFAFFTINLSIVHAVSVLIEPYLGYTLKGDGSTTYTWSGISVQYEHEFKAFALGGRLGIEVNSILFGVDYSQQSFNLDTTCPLVTSYSASDKVEKKQTGIFIGYKPLGTNFKFWGTYFLSSDVTGKDAEKLTNQYMSEKSKFSDGKGFGAGFGYLVSRYVSINLEYRKITYGSYTYDGRSQDEFISDKFNLKEFMLSVSFPFTF
ncbi:MAG: hypothetical protein HQK49_07705 [Oligoflexia bacterium]|nr:hypothetical protein [Oligoflexia bacterium]